MTDVSEKKEPAPAELPLQPSAADANKDAPKNSSTTAAPKAEQPRQDEPNAKKRNGTVIAIIALVIVIGATVTGYGGWHQLNQKQSALEERLSAEEQTLSGLQSSSQSASQSASDSAHSLQQQLTTLTEGIDSMKQHDALLDERLTVINQRFEERSSTEWRVTEARHLVNIASQQAQLNHNTKTALAALEAADQRLLDADEPSLLKARQALTDDITTLRGVASIDIPGIALLLSQLEQQVTGLPLANSEAEAQPATVETASEGSALERALFKVWSDIKGLVTVRHNSGPVGSALTIPDQRIYLQQNLRLKLEVARLALLQRDTQTFRDSLATIRLWLESYYDTKADNTAAMLTSLAPLATLELQPELPDISSSLRALDSWMEKHKSRTKTEAPLKRETTPS